MTDQQGAGSQIPDPIEFSKAMAQMAERAQRIVADFLARKTGDGLGLADPLNIGSAFLEMTTRLMTDPAKLWQSQINLWQAHMDLWQSAARRLMGDPDPRRPSRRPTTAASRTPPGRRTSSSTSSSSPIC
jgi:polyhydroxyalkanoate synthase